MNLLSAIFSLAARIVLGVASLVLVALLVLVGVAVFCGVLLWSLLRGRKPVLRSTVFQRAGQMGAQTFGGRAGPFGPAGPFGGKRQPEGEVVDVEVREVTPSQPRLDLDR